VLVSDAPSTNLFSTGASQIVDVCGTISSMLAWHCSYLFYLELQICFPMAVAQLRCSSTWNPRDSWLRLSILAHCFVFGNGLWVSLPCRFLCLIGLLDLYPRIFVSQIYVLVLVRFFAYACVVVVFSIDVVMTQWCSCLHFDVVIEFR
jgi:hypothetical protein